MTSQYNLLVNENIIMNLRQYQKTEKNKRIAVIDINVTKNVLFVTINRNFLAQVLL